MIENCDRRRPDHALGAEVRLVSRVIEHELDGDEVLGDEALHGWLGIRHGIQRMAAGSVLLGKIGQHKATLLARAFKSGGKIVLPNECSVVHTGMSSAVGSRFSPIYTNDSASSHSTP